MKALIPIRFCALALGLSATFPIALHSDTLVLGTRTVTGTVLQTNGDNVLLLTDVGMLNYPRVIIQEIKLDRAEAVDFSSTTRLPNLTGLVVFLAKQPWAGNLKQIPATVIDKGILRNVPYVSYRCGEDYELNVYGDPSQPAGLEVGVYHALVSDDKAKRNCIQFISAVLGQAQDRETLQSLSLEAGIKDRDGLTFEVTPPSADDSYGGWWVSAYSEQKLSQSRASDAELKQISVTKVEALRQSGGDPAAWTADDLKQARPSPPSVISFTTPDGQTVTDAEVVRVVDGYAVIWRKGASGGTVKLADLSPDLRRRFGYDPAKAAYADEVEKARRAANASVPVQTPASASSTPSTSTDYSSGSSGGGSVYVRGYTRKDGTYVHSYTRRR